MCGGVGDLMNKYVNMERVMKKTPVRRSDFEIWGDWIRGAGDKVGF